MFTLYLHKNHTELLINSLFLLCLDLSVARYKNLLSNRMKALQIFGFNVKTPKLAWITALLWVGRCCHSFTVQTCTCRNGSLDLLLLGARLQSGAEHAGKRLHWILFWPSCAAQPIRAPGQRSLLSVQPFCWNCPFPPSTRSPAQLCISLQGLRGCDHSIASTQKPRATPPYRQKKHSSEAASEGEIITLSVAISSYSVFNYSQRRKKKPLPWVWVMFSNAKWWGGVWGQHDGEGEKGAEGRQCCFFSCFSAQLLG